jgi:hypothetical protein
MPVKIKTTQPRQVSIDTFRGERRGCVRFALVRYPLPFPFDSMSTG